MAELVVGIIGGMGPAATVDLQQRIIAATPAKDDADHLHVLVDNNAKVPSRIKALLEGSGESPAPCMISMAQGLVAAGAQILAMPCNTAHHYYQEVAAQVDVPFLNIVDVAGEFFEKMRPQPVRIGLLASTAVQRIELYSKGLEKRGMHVVFPQDSLQSGVMDVIRAVKAGADSTEHHDYLTLAGEDLRKQQADLILIACTELSALGSQLNIGLPVADAAQLLAEDIVRRAKS